MFDNKSDQKNYIMEREFLLLRSNKELLGRLNIVREYPAIVKEKELGLVAKVFEKGLSLEADSPLLYNFEVHIRLDNVKQKFSLVERDELILSCNFTPRDGSNFLGGEVKFPAIFSK